MKKNVCILGLVLLCTIIMAAFSPADAPLAQSGSISVLLPPWAEPPQDLLAEFQESSGITVELNIMGWDQIHDKITIAAVTNTAAADVVEIDWSWTNEFLTAGVMEPLELTDEEKAKFPLYTSFEVDGQVLGLPFVNDFRMAYYNTDHFEQAGIEQLPTTWDELVEAALKIKAAGISEYPLSFVLSASEGAGTQLMWMSLSRTGALFQPDNSLNADNLLDSIAFVNKMLTEDKIIDPAAVSLTDVEADAAFRAGNHSIIISGGNMLERANNPEESNVVGKVQGLLIPGANEIRSATFGLPEGVGITKHSENKEAARAFIDWYLSEEIQIAMFEKEGGLPSNGDAFSELGDEGRILGSDILLEQAGYMSSPFPGGVPVWYSEFNGALVQAVNRMGQGSITPEQVVAEIEQKVNQLNQ